MTQPISIIPAQPGTVAEATQDFDGQQFRFRFPIQAWVHNGDPSDLGAEAMIVDGVELVPVGEYLASLNAEAAMESPYRVVEQEPYVGT